MDVPAVEDELKHTISTILEGDVKVPNIKDTSEKMKDELLSMQVLLFYGLAMDLVTLHLKNYQQDLMYLRKKTLLLVKIRGKFLRRGNCLCTKGSQPILNGEGLCKVIGST